MERRLHIGGMIVHPAWEIFDIFPRQGVNHVGDARDLSRFPESTFEQVYASHVLEHFDYQNSLLQAIKEWRRVLKPGGELWISVPDLDVLTRLFTDRENTDANERFQIMRMIYGGHIDSHDYHYVGLNEEFLYEFLARAGFQRGRRVEEFRLFADTSSQRFKGKLISLNVISVK